MKVATRSYRATGRVVGRALGELDGVIGVYARRSVATGEVAFARSDIDLHVLISPSDSLEEEGRLLRDLFVRYRRAQRLLPCLGHAWVSTRGGLERWYREQPSEWYRDRAWLRLWGEEFDRPRVEVGQEGREGLLWWYTWAAGILPESFRRGNARRCWNLVLDLFDVFRLYTGLEQPALSRAELFELWSAWSAPGPGRELIQQARRQGFRADRGAVLPAIYRESLALHDALFEHAAWRLDGHGVGVLESRVPPLYARQRYVVAELADAATLDRGLEVMRRDTAAWLLNESGLKLYLAYRNPWEYRALAAANPDLELAPPPESAFQRTLRRALFREIPRTFGFMAEPRLAGPLYAQRRLYLDEGFVAAGSEELAGAYEQRYGGRLETDVPVEEYFLRCYPDLCGIIDDLRARTGADAGTSRSPRRAGPGQEYT